MSQIMRLTPYTYVCVEDNNRNVRRIVCGPCTYTKEAHETIVGGPNAMTVIPPGHYCMVRNPVVRDDAGVPVKDAHDVYVCDWGAVEVRETCDPFPLYPGEEMAVEVSAMQVVDAGVALRLFAQQPYDGHEAGERWLLHGPTSFIPHPSVSVEARVAAVVVRPNQAARVRALQAHEDQSGTARAPGDEWLVRDCGEFMPLVHQEVVDMVHAHILTETKALHLRAALPFTDIYGQERYAGEEWLVTPQMTAVHIVDVHETLVANVTAVTLQETEYCVLHDPFVGERQMLGTRQLVHGPKTFFLLPGETIPQGIESTYLLGEHDALLVRCDEAFEDETETARAPGDRWLVRGPRAYCPPIAVTVLDDRSVIPLDRNDGIYVRDLATGTVRAHIGSSYLLQANEELWEKELPPAVEDLIMGGSPFTENMTTQVPSGLNRTIAQTSSMVPMGMQTTMSVHTGAGAVAPTRREKWRVVSYRVPHNSCVQLFDYKRKVSRVVFGPELVLLEPDEQFTQLSLSGGVPKQGNAIRSLLMFLGPDFMTDAIVVETSDHARLTLELSYNWHFAIDRDNPDHAEQLFSVVDWVGDACKTLSARIRAVVAATPFQQFHAHSAQIIRKAIFGDIDDILAALDAAHIVDGSPSELEAAAAEAEAMLLAQDDLLDEYHFPSNNLMVTGVDIRKVDPIDQRTRDSLQRAVQLAIEITTDTLEASARNEAAANEQKAKGTLELHKITDSCLVEKAKLKLITLQAESEAVKTTGKSKAEAEANASRAVIEGESEVEQAKLRVECADIEANFELDRLKSHYSAEVTHQRALSELEINRERSLAQIESTRFKGMVEAIGPATIAELASAGVDTQAEILKSLGLQGYMVTSADNPINLFNTANGMLAQATQQH